MYLLEYGILYYIDVRIRTSCAMSDRAIGKEHGGIYLSHCCLEDGTRYFHDIPIVLTVSVLS
jgi:hypothetical protein